MGGDQEATGNNSRMEGLRRRDGRVEEVEDAPPRMVLEKPGQLSSGQGVRLNEANVGSNKGVVVRTDGECRVMGTSQVAPSFAVAHGKVRRHLATSAECPICHDGEEDLDHILRSCPTACELWRRILGPIRFADFCLNPFDVWLMDNLSCTDAWMGGRMEWGACFSVWCWLLWKFRCSRVLDEDFIEREGIYDRGCRLLVECESTFGVTVAPVRELHRRQCWVGLAREWVKLNVDAAVGVSDDRASVGGVIRGADDEWIFGFTRFAVNCRRVELETDNKEVERILKHDSESLGASALVMSIHEWLRKDWVVIVRHVPRECNGVADSLAALGRDYGWQGSTFLAPPWGIVHRLDDERQQWLSTRPVQRFVDDPG
ncbi:hypothetical protein V6N11_075335 [Hibiscus sabdariffa]|uniref:RNase H type-1 domain-containing protein n=1 Tax=Hibiscus sabdariffa TaxID=183260 RepID=A0ABR2R694_9ROSI